MLRQTNTYNRVLLCFSFLATVLFQLINGYQFNSGDLAEHLPLVYHNFDDTLYAKDVFVQYAAERFTVRSYWVLLVTLFSHLFPTSVVCYALYMLCLFFAVFAIMRISRVISSNDLTPIISVILALFVFRTTTVGGNQLLGIAFVSSIPAESLALWSLYFALNNNYKISGVLCGLAVWFQALVGLQIAMLVTVVVLHNRSSVRSVVTFAWVFVLSSSPMLVPLVYNLFYQQPDVDKELYYTILYEYRTFLHYLPELFSLKDYVTYSLLLLATILLLYKTKRWNTPVIRVGLAVIIGCVLYTVLIHVFHVKAIGMLQWFKTTVWLNLLCCMVIADFISNFVTIKLANPKRFIPFSLLIAAALWAMVLVTAALPITKLQGRYQIGYQQKTALQSVHEWVANNTPKDALFLVPPEDDSFSCEAKRSMPVNYKAVVHDKGYMLRWYQTMQRYYLVDFNRLGDKKAIEVAIENYRTHIVAPADATYDYRIDNLSQTKLDYIPGEVVFCEGDWQVTKLN